MRIRKFNENSKLGNSDFKDVLVRLQSIGNARMPSMGYDDTLNVDDEDFEYCYMNSEFKSLLYGEQGRMYKGVYLEVEFDGDKNFEDGYNEQPYDSFLKTVDDYNIYTLFLQEIKDIIMLYEKDYYFVEFSKTDNFISFLMFSKQKI